jgi:hypothetical protein
MTTPIGVTPKKTLEQELAEQRAEALDYARKNWRGTAGMGVFSSPDLAQAMAEAVAPMQTFSDASLPPATAELRKV